MNIKQVKTQVGDVLLCYSREMAGKAEGLEHGYSHAAVCLNSTDIFEATGTGVKKSTIEQVLREYGHIAVLRSYEIWSNERIAELHEFAEGKDGRKFNLIGMRRYKEKKDANQQTATDQVLGVFDGKVPPASSDRRSYFCSELVTAVWIHVGIIGRDASVLFRPETMSPEDIGRDKAFGYFVGYILSHEQYAVPVDDIFRTSV